MSMALIVSDHKLMWKIFGFCSNIYLKVEGDDIETGEQDSLKQ
jgi:hypothetical protein